MSAITSHPSRRVRGFSLVELATTITIIAVLAGIAAPSMTSLMARHRVQDASTDLFVTLLKARSEALTLNGEVSVLPVGGDWASGWQIPDPGNAGKFFDVHQPVSSIAISLSGASSVTYQFNGRIRSSGGVKFNIRSSVMGQATGACIAVDPSGRPYSQDGPCAG
jgi:type IV fimbrial biogenesis protein FimT